MMDLMMDLGQDLLLGLGSLVRVWGGKYGG